MNLVPQQTLLPTSGAIKTIPHFNSYGNLPAVSASDNGKTATIPQLLGEGRIPMVVEKGRWAVAPGGVIAALANPFAVVSASSVDTVIYTLFTAPGGIWGSGEEFEIFSPTETGANTGSDGIGSIIAGTVLATQNIAANSQSQQYWRMQRDSGRIRMLQYARTGNFSTAIINYIPQNMDANYDVALRIVPATIGNSCYVRRFVMRRLS